MKVLGSRPGAIGASIRTIGEPRLLAGLPEYGRVSTPHIGGCTKSYHGWTGRSTSINARLSICAGAVTLFSRLRPGCAACRVAARMPWW
jgi:hypothetical protein